MKRILSLTAIITLTAAIVGCSSGVKLNDVPVENRAPVATGQSGTGDASGVTGRAVEPVLIGATDPSLAGPPGAARVIYFDYDSFVIKPEAQATVEAHARFLNANKTRKLVIEGNTDERGGREYNLALGQRRAEAVVKTLQLMGARGPDLEAISFGEERPADAGHDEAAWVKNRRAELTYVSR